MVETDNGIMNFVIFNRFVWRSLKRPLFGLGRLVADMMIIITESEFKTDTIIDDKFYSQCASDFPHVE